MTSQAIIYAAILFVMSLISSACKTSPPVVQQTSVTTSQPSATIATPQKEEDEGKSAEEFFTKEETLSYNGYEVSKSRKKINYRYSDEKSDLMDVHSVVVKKSQKTLATFDGDPHPYGNGVDFGLFPFLGKEGKQLIVSTTVPRGGRQWIVDLSNTYREIFDTGKWVVGREGADLGFIDIDKDGVWEIETGEFWYSVFDEISISETPVAYVIFKYDAKAKTYLPANHLFPEYALKHLKDMSNTLPPQEGYGYLGRRVDVLLIYLYAGKEKEGWEFFDRSYQTKDKNQIKARIRNVLKKSAVYQYAHKLQH